MDRLKERIAVAEICPGHNPQTSNQARGQIRNNVAVQVLQQQDIECGWVKNKLQAGIIDDDVAKTDSLILAGYFSRAVKKQAVTELHNICLVHRDDLFSPEGSSVIKSKLRDPC